MVLILMTATACVTNIELDEFLQISGQSRVISGQSQVMLDMNQHRHPRSSRLILQVPPRASHMFSIQCGT